MSPSHSGHEKPVGQDGKERALKEKKGRASGRRGSVPGKKRIGVVKRESTRASSREKASKPQMVTGVEHIGIAVKDSDEAAELMRAIFGAKVLETIVSQERGLKLTFLDAGGTRVELLEPLTEEGTVAKFLETKGEGFHHIAFKVRDIKSALSLLRQAGVKLVEPAPQKGAHGNLMAFIHPSSACGMLVELCERK